MKDRASGDVARVLSGKASGVQVTNQGGISGSGTSVIIRGLSTFSSSNQPLFVVDGVPFQVTLTQWEVLHQEIMVLQDSWI